MENTNHNECKWLGEEKKITDCVLIYSYLLEKTYVIFDNKRPGINIV